MEPERPAVSVVIPFAGTASECEALVSAVRGLTLRDGDEVVVVDDNPHPLVPETPPLRVVRTGGSGSSYTARNAGVASARNEWLLFTDADCAPVPDLLERYFDPPPAAETGLVSGAILPLAGGNGFVASYQRSRVGDEQEAHAAHPHRPFAATGNLLVRRAALAEVGGFHDGVRSGGDVDMCWRVQEAGWGFERRPGAVVHHSARSSWRAMIRQHLRYGAGSRWLAIRHPGAGYTRPVGPRLVRALGAAARDLARARPREAARRATDAVVIAVAPAGGLLGNRCAPSRERGRGRRVTLLVDSFPELSETFVTAEAQALAELGASVRVEALGRARRPSNTEAVGLDARFMEDDGLLERARDLAWLIRRHPAACLADLRDRRSWAREETVLPLRAVAPIARRCANARDEHLHAHFAAGAALLGLRLSRLLGVPYSVTLHGYDIFKTPRNVAAKLDGAAFATSGSHFTVAAIRRLHPPCAGKLERVVMGVDPRLFKRSRPYPGGGQVVAVGRLVEKKGFATLLEAAALMRRDQNLERIVIVGEGPLRDDLEKLHGVLGLGDRVRLAGPRAPAEVRELLEAAAVVAIPCVIAPDGDADSMPVIAKEAMAMSVPLVTSDAAGLPEVAMEPWAKVVAAGDAAALAGALTHVLALPVDERAAMGAAGRRHVEGHFTVLGETARLLAMIDRAVSERARR